MIQKYNLHYTTIQYTILKNESNPTHRKRQRKTIIFF